MLRQALTNLPLITSGGVPTSHDTEVWASHLRRARLMHKMFCNGMKVQAQLHGGQTSPENQLKTQKGQWKVGLVREQTVTDGGSETSSELRVS